jgi:hypothetical protein
MREHGLGWASRTADELHGWEELGARHGNAPGRGAPWQGEEDEQRGGAVREDKTRERACTMREKAELGPGAPWLEHQRATNREQELGI